MAFVGHFETHLRQDFNQQHLHQHPHQYQSYRPAPTETLFRARPGYGVHEVLIETPEHNRHPGALTVVRPRTIEMIERRRATRRRFRTAVGVQLYTCPAGRRPIECILLNLSARGLACRADAKVINDVFVGSIVRVHFVLESGAAPFEFDARIITATPSDEGNFVLGIEFVENRKADAQRERLAGILSSSMKESRKD